MRQKRKRYMVVVTKGFFVSLSVVIFTLWPTYDASAAHYYVDPAGKDSSNGLSWKTAFATIKHAIEKTSNTSDDIIDVNSGNYTTGPIALKSGLTLNFHKNVTISAEPNAFGLYDQLFRAWGKSDITFKGNRTILQMNKEEYTDGEWRHVIGLFSSSNIELDGLILRNSGGDGIYIGTVDGSSICGQDIKITNVICDNNRRNGISIISGGRILIDNCFFRNSNGTSPESGIVIEPNFYYEDLNDIKIINTVVENNARRGIHISLNNLTSYPAGLNDVNIAFENIYIVNNKWEGICVSEISDSCRDGEITFDKVTVVNSKKTLLVQKSYLKIDLTFNNCVLMGSEMNPVLIGQQDNHYVNPGGINFNDCQVFDNFNRAALVYLGDSNDTLCDITGRLYVENNKRKTQLFDWRKAYTNNVTIILNSGTLSWADAYNTCNYTWYSSISSAASSATDSDIILIPPETHYEQADFNGKMVTICSIDPNDWGVVESTVIDANGANQAVLFDSCEGANSVLSGFTIRDGTYGIRCTSSGPKISRCIISGNTSGIFSVNSSATITNCKISDNVDGIFGYVSSASITNNWIYDNSNSGIYLYNSAGNIINNTITHNTGWGVKLDSCTLPTVTNCILWGNGRDLSGSYGFSVNYSCFTNGYPYGQGNIIGDPCFVDDENDDYHLKLNSPCIDKGHPNGNYDGQVDIDGDIRAVDDDFDGVIEIDMGADEIEINPLDLNVDGIVDYYELNALMREWLQGGIHVNLQNDFHQDGCIDFLDFAELANQWLWKAYWYEK